MNPMENLFNYITGDNILFSVVQGILIIFTFLALFSDFRRSKTKTVEVPTQSGKVSGDIRGFLFVGLVIFFTTVCFSTDEIIGHRIFWLTLDVGLLAYLFLLSRWVNKRIGEL